MDDLLDELHAALKPLGGEWAIRLETGYAYAWSAEVRVTRHPNTHGTPDRSIVFFNTGGGTADEAAEPAIRAAIAEVADWA